MRIPYELGFGYELSLNSFISVIVEFWPRKFSTVVMYGGFFFGSGKNKGYIDGARAIYDHCDADYWSEAAVHFIQADLGYVDTSACNVYWLEDGQGLRVMKWEEDAQKTADFQKMAAVAGSGMTLRLYVDSVNFHASEESPDDVLQGPVAVLPSVLVSPIKNKLRRGAGDCNLDEVVEFTNGALTLYRSPQH